MSELFVVRQASVALKVGADTLILVGSGCSRVVECTACDREVESSKPAGCWAFFLFSILSIVHPYFRSLEEVDTTDFPITISLLCIN